MEAVLGFEKGTVAEASQKFNITSYLMCKTLGVCLGSCNKWKYKYVSERQKWKMMVKEESTTIFIALKNVMYLQAYYR
jgi:hypothetical protein